MKTRYIVAFWMALCATCSAQVTNALIATNAVATTNAVQVPPALLPTTSLDMWDVAIGVLSPIVIWMLTKITPRIPKPFLPAITPLVGIGLGLILNWMTAQHISWFESAKAGAMAVFFRELVNQWITKKMAEDTKGAAVVGNAGNVESTPVVELKPVDPAPSVKSDDI